MPQTEDGGIEGTARALRETYGLPVSTRWLRALGAPSAEAAALRALNEDIAEWSAAAAGEGPLGSVVGCRSMNAQALRAFFFFFFFFIFFFHLSRKTHRHAILRFSKLFVIFYGYFLFSFFLYFSSPSSPWIRASRHSSRRMERAAILAMMMTS
jgi:hypothetical protein